MSFEAADWPLPANVRAGWTSRALGLSSAPFDSYNLALHVGDDDALVEQNRADLHARLDGKPTIVWLNQTHSKVVVDVDLADKNISQDGSYTSRKGHACCVMTADCLPVFLWDKQGEQIAMAHAGWRGLADGILRQALATFANASDVSVGIGPAIGKEHFEVGEDVVESFASWPDRADFFNARSVPGKYDCDLAGLAQSQLLSLDAAAVYQSGLCSFEQRDRFFSYRRDGKTGRMANLIWKIE